MFKFLMACMTLLASITTSASQDAIRRDIEDGLQRRLCEGYKKRIASLTPNDPEFHELRREMNSHCNGSGNGQYRMHVPSEDPVVAQQEQDLIAASCACNWPAYKKLIKKAPGTTLAKNVLIPESKEESEKFDQYVPDQDYRQEFLAIGAIQKWTTIPGIVTRFCPARFAQLAFRYYPKTAHAHEDYPKAAHEVRPGAASSYISMSLMSICANQWPRQVYNDISIERLAQISGIETQQKLSLIQAHRTQVKKQYDQWLGGKSQSAPPALAGASIIS